MEIKIQGQIVEIPDDYCPAKLAQTLSKICHNGMGYIGSFAMATVGLGANGLADSWYSLSGNFSEDPRGVVVANSQTPMAVSGTLRNFRIYMHQNDSPLGESDTGGPGVDVDFRLNLNGVDTPVHVILPANSPGIIADLENSVEVHEGDLLCFHAYCSDLSGAQTVVLGDYSFLVKR